ncbi:MULTISPECIES: hypothetical protein [Vibrio]|uniref:Uncharacterized protein n=1 Tax=Vibrio tasmaniensis TaxID=212663 RepID=A0A2N7NCM4_9VIBR|nr:hypothetical protein [Vibrio tasmaniensis]PMO89876.1 hypothetical protein BCT01_00925 [Vibrio tasmaniensis]PMP09952.1 hypothetical protein BCS92_02165 [Vibrio tasmaniensis]TKG27981.1 hypothetical protein FC057_22600 [Vibrio tasmaniensis]TKG41654.1 hypothetical protein FC063_07270 [Vibrio tasmaniensis]TKG42067.1 hypothetical protein FC060_21920 [Vibrio tasmaniensis]
MNQWSKLTPTEAIKKLKKLNAELGKNKTTDDYIKGEFNSFSETTSQRLKILLRADWKDRNSVTLYIQSLVSIKVELDTFGDLIPTELHDLIDINLSKIDGAIDSLNVPTIINTTSDIQQSCYSISSQVAMLSTCNKNIMSKLVNDNELRYMQSKLNHELRCNIALRTSVDDLSNKIDMLRLSNRKVDPVSLLMPSKERGYVPTFQSEYNGFCFSPDQLATIRLSNSPSKVKRKEIHKGLRSCIPFLSYIKQTLDHNGTRIHKVSNGLTINQFQSGQITFNHEHIELAKSFSLKYITKQKPGMEPVLIWGSETFTTYISENLKQKAIPCTILKKDIITSIKAFKEVKITPDEQAAAKANNKLFKTNRPTPLTPLSHSLNYSQPHNPKLIS